MGVWNAHTSVGNISGSLLAASVLDYRWGWSFILPGAFIFLTGVVVYFFLPAYLEDVGFPCANGVVAVHSDEEDQAENVSMVGDERLARYSSVNRRSIGLVGASTIPGVIPFALCLFFLKLVAYTFLYWLPFYLSQTAIGGEYMFVKSSGNLSTLFDVGGIVGGILAGLLSDWFDARATTSASFMYAAIPAMLLYRVFGGVSKALNIFLMFLAGLFVNGPYALITTAVSADLWTHMSLRGDSRALATVTAIIDGIGSLGAALGPLVTGFLSTKGWDAVFIMLTIGALCAALLLSNLVAVEVRGKFSNQQANGERDSGGSSSEPLLRDGRQ